jgi:hypothetical protein
MSLLQGAEHHTLPAILRSPPSQGLEGRDLALPLALLSLGVVGWIGDSLTIPQV